MMMMMMMMVHPVGIPFERIDRDPVRYIPWNEIDVSILFRSYESALEKQSNPKKTLYKVKEEVRAREIREMQRKFKEKTSHENKNHSQTNSERNKTQTAAGRRVRT